MKSLSLIVLLLLSISVMAQNKKAKWVMSLQMPEGGGTRGAGVVWHPIQKKYYAAFAGNSTFPMGVFDAKGKLLSLDTLTTMVDIRGLWYNPDSKTIDGNGYDDFGWFSYVLGKNGIPSGVNFWVQTRLQPGDQSQGCYNVITKQVYFYADDNEFKTYSPVSFEEKASTPVVYKSGASSSDYYASAICNEKGEIGLLNPTAMEVDFYDGRSGKYKYTINIPENTHVADNFSFAYTNGMIWLFDDDTRKWNGFK